MNLPWVNLTGYTGMECEGRELQSLLDYNKDPEGSNHFDQLLNWLNTENKVKMHVNVYLTKKPKTTSGSISRRSSAASSTSGYFGSQTVYSSDVPPALPEMTPSNYLSASGQGSPRHNLNTRRSSEFTGVSKFETFEKKNEIE